MKRLLSHIVYHAEQHSDHLKKEKEIIPMIALAFYLEVQER